MKEKNATYIVEAIDLKSPLNEEHKPAYQFVKNGNRFFFLLDCEKPIDFPRISDYIKRFCATNKKNLNVNLNSFLAVFHCEDFKKAQKLINVVALAFCFYQKKPFSMKTNGDTKNYSLKFNAPNEYKKTLEHAVVLANAQFFCRKLQDMPSNLLDPKIFVDYYLSLFEEVKDKIAVKVLDKQQLEAEGLNLLLGVNKGSAKEPRLLCVEYLNNPDSKEKFGYIGKGITFDSGGMNIKTLGHMRNMKFDMSGAATVMSTIYALAKNEVKTNVVAIAALTENVISHHAQRPDDIIVSYSKKTVEIDNTDAEGRLVLADALWYALQNYQVTKLVDIATLTGAIKICLGDVYTGVWATSQEDWKAFNHAAFHSGEYVWRLPFHEDYLKIIASKVADIANSSNVLGANSSVAACFLKEFTNNLPFIHLDVASTTTVNNEGQGVMLNTLYHFAKYQH